MKKIFKIIAGIFGFVFVLLLAAALILPPIILNKYEDKITTLISEKTGRDITLGDMSLRLLPSPQLRIQNVVVPSVEGAAEAQLASMDSFRIKVAILPLLVKTLKIKNIELVNAKVTAEILPDGSNNWTFAALEKAEDPNQNKDEKPQKASGFKVVAQDARLINSSVTYLDRRPETRQLLNIADANLSVAMQSLTGPFKAKGDLIWNGQDLNVDLKTGQLDSQTPSQFNGKITIDKGHRLSFGGKMALKPNILFNGKAHIESSNPSGVAQKLGFNIGNLPSVPVAIDAHIEGNDKVAKAEDVKISVGKSSLEASADWSLGEQQVINAVLRGKTVDIDQILSSLSSSKPTEDTKKGAIASPQKSAKASNAAFQLPNNLTLKLDAQVQELIFNQGEISNLKLLAQMADGKLNVSDISAVLPGSSPVGASASVENGKKEPLIKGNFSFTSDRPRDLVTWLGGDITNIPADRIKEINLRSDIAGNLKQVTLNNIIGQVDESHLNGQISLSLADRMKINADLSIDQIQADPWINAFSEPKVQRTSMKDVLVLKAHAATATKAAKLPFDVQFKLALANLFYQGIKISGIQTDLDITNSNLKLTKVQINDLSGAQILVSGVINDVVGQQVAKNLKVNLKAKSIAGLLKLAKVDIDIPAEKIGAISSDVILNGSLKQSINVDATAQAVGGSYGAKGQINPKNINFKGLSFWVKHKNINQVASLFAPDVKIPKGAQSIDLKGVIDTQDKIYKLSKFSGVIGKSNIKSATITADLSADKPNVTMDMAAGTLDLDALQNGASSKKSSSKKKKDTAKRKAGVAPWNDDVIDYSGLGAANANINLTADQLIVSGKKMTGVQLQATLKDSLLNISQLKAQAYGGKVDVSAKVDGRGKGAIESNLAVNGISLSQLVKDTPNAKFPLGQLNLNTNLVMVGNTSRQLISSLNGSGDMQVSDIRSQQTGSGLDSFLGLMQKINAADNKGLLDTQLQFQAQNGIVNVNPMKLSGLIGGNATGTVDLPSWVLDINGVFNFEGGASQLLLAILSKEDQNRDHPFRVYGSIDNPDMDLPSDLQKAFNLYKGVSEGDLKALVSGGVSGKLLQKLGLSDKNSSAVTGLLNMFGGEAPAASDQEQKPAKNIVNQLVDQVTKQGGGDKNNQETDKSQDALGNILDGQIDKVLGEGSGGGDAAKELINKGAEELLKGLFN